MVETYKISGFDALIAAITDPEPTPEPTPEETPEVTEAAPKSTRKKNSSK